MLQRFVALLLSLAMLAERAGEAIAPLRCLILWILRPAEFAARCFVGDVADDFVEIFPDAGFWLDPDEIDDVRTSDSRDDALALAIRFRALAAILEGSMRQTVFIERRWACMMRNGERRGCLDNCTRLWPAGVPRPALASVQSLFRNSSRRGENGVFRASERSVHKVREHRSTEKRYSQTAITNFQTGSQSLLAVTPAFIALRAWSRPPHDTS